MIRSPESYWNHNAAFHDELVADAAARGGRALDAGCGEGLLLSRLADVCEEVVGVEVDAATASRARSRLGEVPGACVRQADLLQGTKGLGTFQTVTCVAALHHLPLEAGLRVLGKLVAPGGRLLVIGLAANRGLADWTVSALSIVPNWVSGRLHHETRDIGVPVARPRESLRQIRAVARQILPGACIRRRRYFRYSLSWDRPGLET